LERLLKSDSGRQAFDLAVRLTPEAALGYLATGKEAGRVELFAAWNRRLALGREGRPIPRLEKLLDKLAQTFSTDRPPAEVEAHLRFLGSWPALREPYRAALQSYLQHTDEKVILAGLGAQQRAPLLLDLNEALIQRRGDSSRIVEQALRNYAYDESGDHAATLRRLWKKLPTEQGKARWQYLFAMGVYPKENDRLALEAVKERRFNFLDVALPVLRRGDAETTRDAIGFVLDHSVGELNERHGRQGAMGIEHDGAVWTNLLACRPDGTDDAVDVGRIA
jgi:hypothetical protein